MVREKCGSGGGTGVLVSAPTRPVLRYHGGKWRLAPWIISHFPEHRVYVESFGGGGSVLLRKPRPYAEVYNDLDGEVVNLFRVLRDPSTRAQLVEAIALTPFAREEFDGAYQETADPVESARRLVLLSHAGFGTAAMRVTQKGIRQRTGFRGNSTRSGTTPAWDWRGMPDVIANVGERMTGVGVEHRDANIVIKAHDAPTTLHFVDPPYPHSTRSDSSRWNYRHEMSDDDHRALAETLHAASGMVVLSGYACELYDSELYADWTRRETATHADGARKRTEVLWLNPACSAALKRGECGMTPRDLFRRPPVSPENWRDNATSGTPDASVIQANSHWLTADVSPSQRGTP